MQKKGSEDSTLDVQVTTVKLIGYKPRIKYGKRSH